MTSYEIWVARMDGPEEWWFATLSDEEKELVLAKLDADGRVNDFTVDTIDPTDVRFLDFTSKLDDWLENYDGGQP